MDLLLNGAGDLLKDMGKAKILNAFFNSVFTDNTGFQEYSVHYCLTPSLVTRSMEECAPCAALPLVQDWEECQIHHGVVLS